MGNGAEKLLVEFNRNRERYVNGTRFAFHVGKTLDGFQSPALGARTVHLAVPTSLRPCSRTILRHFEYATGRTAR